MRTFSNAQKKKKTIAFSKNKRNSCERAGRPGRESITPLSVLFPFAIIKEAANREFKESSPVARVVCRCGSYYYYFFILFFFSSPPCFLYQCSRRAFEAQQISSSPAGLAPHHITWWIFFLLDLRALIIRRLARPSPPHSSIISIAVKIGSFIVVFVSLIV